MQTELRLSSVALPLLLALAPGCSGSTSHDDDPDNGSGGGSGSVGAGGAGGSIEQCVESFTGVTIGDACKACLAQKCVKDSTAYCDDPGYPAAKACYDGCPTCSIDCEIAYSECSVGCSVGDAACCSTCGEERKTCSSSCPTPACDCMPLGGSLFDAAAGLASCMTFSCLSECAAQIGSC